MADQYVPSGKHLIAGTWTEGEGQFESQPVTGEAHTFSMGTPALVDTACKAAGAAVPSYGFSSRQARAEFLSAIADEIEARAEAITAIGCAETGLPEARLQGERGRTVGQIRLFAEHILKGEYLDRRHDEALPERQPLPRPDLRMMQRPIGPVAVFGASNFPLAFSTAGGDTASALAAGCPVVVKGHPAHPGTGEIIAEAIHAAIQKCGLHPGVFSLVQGGNRDIGEALVRHPLINAVGFTGSLAGGRALFDLCASRPNPIPFFGELGSINPVFVLPSALTERAADIGAGWAASLTMGAGQFCTNPGILVVPEGEQGDELVNAAKAALSAASPQTMLTAGIASAYNSGRNKLADTPDVETLVSQACGDRNATADLLETSGQNWLSRPELGEEVFGPLGLVVRCQSQEQMLAVAESLQGQLTATLQMQDDAIDTEVAKQLLPIIERKVGRILVNGFPTGVEVADAMVHGGPYPASTNFGATSVGTLSIRRFLRPVCYQNIPEPLLPEDLR